MVYLDCSTVSPGNPGVECHKSCGNLDMPPCVCIQYIHAYIHIYTHPQNLHCQCTYSVFSSCVFRSILFGWMQISTGCTSGCVCPDGLVSNGAGSCIKETDCPCVHNGQVYQPGARLTVDCNTWFVHILGYSFTRTHAPTHTRAHIHTGWTLSLKMYCDGYIIRYYNSAVSGQLCLVMGKRVLV